MSLEFQQFRSNCFFLSSFWSSYFIFGLYRLLNCLLGCNGASICFLVLLSLVSDFSNNDGFYSSTSFPVTCTLFGFSSFFCILRPFSFSSPFIFNDMME